MRTRTERFWLAVLAGLVIATGAAVAEAQEKATTCVQVEASDASKEGLTKLVASEVDRHPSHRVVNADCATHLKVELIELAGERFLTGRVGGEVPDRVHVDGKDDSALERAVVELLRVVLGTDPVTLQVPGGRSWFSEQVLALKEHARSTFDVAFLENASLVGGRVEFRPGLLLGYTREIASLQIGIEAMVLQSLEKQRPAVALDTQIRLDAVVTYFFSSEADTSGFAGAGLGLLHQRFSGARAADAGGGVGECDATGPVLGLRAGVELFRTTTTRAFVVADVSVPIFWANDRDSEIFTGWVPTLSLGAGARF